MLALLVSGVLGTLVPANASEPAEGSGRYVVQERAGQPAMGSTLPTAGAISDRPDWEDDVPDGEIWIQTSCDAGTCEATVLAADGSGLRLVGDGGSYYLADMPLTEALAQHETPEMVLGQLEACGFGEELDAPIREFRLTVDPAGVALRGSTRGISWVTAEFFDSQPLEAVCDFVDVRLIDDPSQLGPDSGALAFALVLSRVGDLPARPSEPLEAEIVAPVQPSQAEPSSPAPDVPRPRDVPAVEDVRADGALGALLLALIALVLVVFPSTIFDQTVDANASRIRAFWARVPVVSSLLRHGEGASSAVGFGSAVLTGSALTLWLDPGVGFGDAPGQLIGSAAGFVAVIFLYEGLQLLVTPAGARRIGFRPRFGGLVIAGLTVGISRLAGVSPGYLYGFVATIVALDLAARSGGTRGSALRALVGLAGTLIVAGCVWTAWSWTGAPGGLAGAAAASLWSTAVSTMVLVMLPIKFFQGRRLYDWSKGLWAAAWATLVWVWLFAVVGPANPDTTHASVRIVAVLFGGFATVSISTWAWFRYIPAPAASRSRTDTRQVPTAAESN